MKRTLTVIAMVASLGIPFNSTAQTKFEREYRIQTGDVPELAIQFIEVVAPDAKVKWYRETSMEQVSFEAKYKKKRIKYSIEFDTLGNLQDAELRIKMEDVEQSALVLIRDHLKNHCDHYKALKVQVQYSGRAQSISELLALGNTNRSYLTRYELEVKCKQDGQVHLYEHLFDERGNHLRRRTIVLRNTDNIEF